MSLLKRVFVLLVLTPSPPQNLTVVLRGTNTITIGWQAPVSFISAGTRSYLLRIREPSAQYWTTVS